MSDGLAVTPPRAPGEYVLEGEIAGRPGARWYRARRGERLVALRLFDADDAPESSTLERFLRDAPDRPRHPNLFVVEDVGRVGPDGEAGGALYYSTPTIGGDSLRQILEDLDEGRPRRPSFSPLAVGPEGDRHPGYVEHATGLIAEVAEGLDAAHAAGIVHGRLSPECLVFSRAGRLLLTDFGGPSPLPAVARPYAPPEALAGDGPSGSIRGDVYSLGVVLHELLGGRPPVDRSLRKARRSERPAETEGSRRLADEVSPHVETCLLRALDPRPRARYDSAGELALDLRNALEGRALRASAGQAASGRRPSGRLVTTVAALLGIALLAAFFAARERLRRGEVEDTTRNALSLVERGDYDAADEATELLLSSNVGRPIAVALRDAIADSRRREEAMEILAGSVRVLRGGDGAPTPLATTDLEAALPGLADDSRPELRWAALHVLQSRLAAGDTLSPGSPGSPGSTEVIGRLLRDPDDAVRRLAREVYATVHGGERLAHALGVGEGRAPVDLDGPSFLALQDILCAAENGAAGRLVAGWSLDAMRALDAPGAPDAIVELEPNLQVRRGDTEPGAFLRSWIRCAGALEAASLLDALLDAVPELIARDDLRPTLVEALARSGDTRAVRWLLVIARDHSSSEGRDALDGLASLEAFDALRDLVHSGLSGDFRRAALEVLSEKAPPADVSALLRTLALNDPDPALRRCALERLSSSRQTQEAASFLSRVLDDRELREPALEWLERLQRPTRLRLAATLVAHRERELREKAFSWLAAEPGWAAVSILLGAMFSSSSDTRRAALNALRSRIESWSLRNSLAHCVRDLGRRVAREIVRGREEIARRIAGPTPPASDR